MWTEGGEGMTGAEIMKHRRKNELTQQTNLAQKVGVTVDTVQKWERDIMKPRENNRVRLHVVLGLGHPFRRKLTECAATGGTKTQNRANDDTRWQSGHTR